MTQSSRIYDRATSLARLVVARAVAGFGLRHRAPRAARGARRSDDAVRRRAGREAATEHVLENREASYGGGSVARRRLRVQLSRRAGRSAIVRRARARPGGGCVALLVAPRARRAGRSTSICGPRVFFEPSPDEPAHGHHAGGRRRRACPWTFLEIHAGYEADIVTRSDGGGQGGARPSTSCRRPPTSTTRGTSSAAASRVTGETTRAFGRLLVRHRERLPLASVQRQRRHGFFPEEHRRSICRTRAASTRCARRRSRRRTAPRRARGSIAPRAASPTADDRADARRRHRRRCRRPGRRPGRRCSPRSSC